MASACVRSTAMPQVAPPTDTRRPGWAIGPAALLLWLMRMWGGLLAPRLAQALQRHEMLAGWLFLASSALAVVLPLLSHLARVPAAVQLWGPSWTSAALLSGWTLGSWLAFVIGRLVRHGWLRHAPGLRQATDVDRWTHPRHPGASLVLLRMAFPIDVRSFALGVFSAQTTVTRLLLSALIGAAPFALLFAWLPQRGWPGCWPGCWPVPASLPAMRRGSAASSAAASALTLD